MNEARSRGEKGPQEGVVHCRSLGLASHLGLLCGVPTIGIAKTFLHVDGMTKTDTIAACKPRLLKVRTLEPHNLHCLPRFTAEHSPTHHHPQRSTPFHKALRDPHSPQRHPTAFYSPPQGKEGSNGGRRSRDSRPRPPLQLSTTFTPPYVHYFSQGSIL